MSQKLLELSKRHHAQWEAESIEIEKETGFKRTKQEVTCACGTVCKVRMGCRKIAEGGFLRVDPPHIEEFAACPLCEVVNIHYHLHQQGKGYRV